MALLGTSNQLNFDCFPDENQPHNPKSEFDPHTNLRQSVQSNKAFSNLIILK